MKLVDFIAALAQHIADERGWTLAEATRWVEVRLREARHSETDGVEDQATPQFAIQPLDEHYARLLLAIVAGDRLEALYRVALSLGLRRGEVLGLRWVDVDFERATQRTTGSLHVSAESLSNQAPRPPPARSRSRFRQCCWPRYAGIVRHRHTNGRMWASDGTTAD